MSNLQQSDIFKLVDLYFDQDKIMYQYIYNSYNHVIDEIIPNILRESENIIFEKYANGKIYRYRFDYENIQVQLPTLPNGHPMFPNDARDMNLNYSCKLYASISQIEEIIDIMNHTSEKKVIGNKENDINIATIPVLVKSKYCNTYARRELVKNECEYDPGCYFIVKGSEKIIISLERMCENKIMVLTKRETFGLTYFVQLISKFKEMSNMITVRYGKNKVLMMKISIFNEIPALVLFKALGFVNDKDIVDIIVGNDNDKEMINLLLPSIEDLKQREQPLISKQDAIDFLIGKLKIIRKYTESDAEIKQKQKVIHLMHVLENNFLPHIRKGLLYKGYYLGHMIQSLLSCVLQRRETDDRDSFINKRVDLVGNLFEELFRQYYKKMLHDCGKYIKKRNDDTPINVIKQIKPSTIEQGFNNSLATGNWGKKKGVAQALQRLSYLQTLTFLRRIDLPGVDDASNKLTDLRQYNPSQTGYLCPTETPEHAKVGIIKHLALIAGVTIGLRENTKIVYNYVNELVHDITTVPVAQLYKYTKVYVNGELLGITLNPVDLKNTVRKMKLEGKIDMTTGIAYNIRLRELKIYTDGGRLYRPMLCVKNNKIVLTPDDLKHISLYKKNISDVLTWNKFLLEFPGRVEFVDVEESEFSIFSTKISRVNKMENRMRQHPAIKNQEDIKNRYDENCYVYFTHCEFHPSLLESNLASSIPFGNHNQGPRNMFFYAQGKQAISTYVSNYRFRWDKSYLLYNPQKQLVSTRTKKYIYGDILSNGENIIVAMINYTGHNQEDAIIFNQAALDRGLLRTTSLKKYSSQIQKNQMTSEDDIFVKPDYEKVAGMKHGSYEKLNEKGFVNEEETVEYGDIIIGKITPIQTTGSNKLYKDSSEMYKDQEPGIVDKVWYDICNSDGYEIRKMRIRSERVPNIGDKFCFTPDHDILTDKGWVSIADLTREHKVAMLEDGKRVIYDYPTDLQEFDHDGEMYLVESNHVSLCVTMNHKMYVASRRSEKYKLEEAKDIYGMAKKYKKNADEGIKEEGLKEFVLPAYKELPEVKLDIDAWLTFFGIWLAEGCVHNKIIVFATHKQRVKDALDICCEKLNIEARKFMDGNESIKFKNGEEKQKHNIWNIYDKRVVSYLLPLSVGAINKSLPDWVWKLNMEQCRVLINGMMMGDGHTMSNGTRRYDTSSIKLANDFQRLCLHAGYSTNIAVKYKAGKISVIKKEDRKGETIKSTVDAYRMTIIESQNEPLVNKYLKEGKQLDSKINYNGKVYCCTSKTGIIYVRRDRIPIWSGNSSSHGQKGTLGLKLKQSEMPFTATGITPDILVNPCSMPSRMTIAQFFESTFGKVCAEKGIHGDGTAFSKPDVADLRKQLLECGFREDGSDELYNGITGEKLKVSIFMGPIFYQRLKHLVLDKIHCLRENHEVLTTSGWKSIKDVTLTDVVACFNNGQLVYQKPTKIYHYENYTGKMYHIKNDQIDLDVTINHRMFVSKDSSSEHELEIAENVVGQQRFYKKNADWENDSYQFKLPSVNNLPNKIIMDKWLLFFGMWVSKGYDYVSNINNLDKQIKDYLEQFNYTDTERYLPDWVWNLSATQCQLLIQSMCLNIDKEEVNIFYTISNKLADDFMRLCLHAGWSANKELETNVWKLSIIKTNTELVNGDIKQNQIEEVYDFIGPVYCIKVPSHVFYVRSNGKPVWTGNSRARGPKTKLTRQPPEGRSRDGGLRVGEMERDAILAHGIAFFLKERMMDLSDLYFTYVCGICGLFAQRMIRKSNKPFYSTNDIYFCPACKNGKNISKIRIPYAFKLLIQELISMCICPRIRIKE